MGEHVFQSALTPSLQWSPSMNNRSIRHVSYRIARAPRTIGTNPSRSSIPAVLLLMNLGRGMPRGKRFGPPTSPESDYAACCSRWSISSRSEPKSVGFVSNTLAPNSAAFFFVASSPCAVIMLTGTLGRTAFHLRQHFQAAHCSISLPFSFRLCRHDARQGNDELRK